MKLLFDENLSRRLVKALSGVYPGSAHVADRGLERADDKAPGSTRRSTASPW